MANDAFVSQVPGFPHLWLRANGTYYYWRKLDGQEIKKSFRTKDEQEAQRLYDLEYRNKRPIVAGGVKVEDAWQAFVEDEGRRDTTTKRNRGRRSERSRARYQSAWKMDIAEILGKERVEDVSGDDILFVLERAEDRPAKRTGEPRKYGNRGTYVALSSFFTWCTKVPHRYRDDNPVAQIDPSYITPLPEQEEGEEVVQWVSEEETDRIATAALKHENAKRLSMRVTAIQVSTIVKLAPECGARIGELLATDLTDFTPAPFAKPHGELRLRRQLNFRARVNDQSTWFEPLKGSDSRTRSKARVVGLSRFGERVLNDYIELGRKEGWLREGGLLFPSSKQTPRDPSNVTTRIRVAAEWAGIERRVIAHMFRHTFFSRLNERLREGEVDEKDVDAVGGNTRGVRITTYNHHMDRTALNERIAAAGRS